jgi:hypothetical protein
MLAGILPPQPVSGLLPWRSERRKARDTYAQLFWLSIFFLSLVCSNGHRSPGKAKQTTCLTFIAYRIEIWPPRHDCVPPV